MMSFSFGKFAHAIHEFQCLFEIRKAKLTMDVVLIGYRPPGNAVVNLFKFLSAKGRRAATAGHTLFIG